MKNFIPEYKDHVDSILLSLENVRPGLMFGCPGYYTDQGLAVCHYNDNFFVKLPEDTVAKMLQEDSNASSQGPMGPKRSMGKNWVFLHVPDMKALKGYNELLRSSIAYVASTPRKAKAKKKAISSKQV
jgi:azurin